MPENDSTDGPRRRKPKTVREQPEGVAPVLVPGAVYSREALISLFGASPDTFAKWKEAGLQVYRPMTAMRLVFADDLLALIRRFPVNPEGDD